MSSARPLLLATLAGIAAIGFSTACSDFVQFLLYNPSTSAPRGFYWRDPLATYRVGQYAFARLPAAPAALAAQRGYLPANILLLKPIAAVQGDVVCVRHGLAFINGQLVARLLARDAHGRLLQPWSGCRALDVDEVFLLSRSNPASFDGRYFGPIHYSDLRGVATALWTW
jgi:conjugative transfer signal peptidase TraF